MCNFCNFRWCNLGRMLKKYNCISSNNSLMSILCLNVCRLCVPNIISLGIFLKTATHQSWCISIQHQNSRYFWCLVWKDEKLIKKQTYTNTEICKLYSRVFWTFMPNVIKIDPCNFELYCFKVGTVYETQYINTKTEITTYTTHCDAINQSNVRNRNSA